MNRPPWQAGGGKSAKCAYLALSAIAQLPQSCLLENFQGLCAYCGRCLRGTD